jgi:TonB family protein
MSNHTKSRNVFAFVLSGAAHVAFALSLLAIPKSEVKRYDIVDMTVFEPEKTETRSIAPEPEPPPAEAEALKPEPEKVAVKKKTPAKKPAETSEPAPPPPPPAVEKAPEAAPEAPPTFDLGDNTFAMGNGPGSSWSLKRSEGNTRFAGVAKAGQPSVRHTKPTRTGVKNGVPGGAGKVAAIASVPVPLQNLSKRPKPLDGPVSPPPYPMASKKAGVEGPVVLKVFIDKRGLVSKTQVVQSPDALLAKAAQLTMGKVRWTQPLDKRGKPVDTVIVWRFRFVLDG